MRSGGPGLFSCLVQSGANIVKMVFEGCWIVSSSCRILLRTSSHLGVGSGKDTWAQLLEHESRHAPSCRNTAHIAILVQEIILGLHTESKSYEAALFPFRREVGRHEYTPHKCLLHSTTIHL